VEMVACNLCGSSRQTEVYQIPDRRYFPEEMFSVVACEECGMGYVNPRPTVSEIQKYYPAEYYQQAPTASWERYLRRRFENEAKFLRGLEREGEQPLLLDVGCANGEFPRFMAARKWRVEGVETSESAERIRDFKVYTQQFQDIPVTQPTYDAITAWAVLEHVHDPMGYFRKAASVLKRGGLFVFLVTNFESLASRALFCEDVPRHLYFFTRAAVKRYLQANGLVLESEHNDRTIYKLAPSNWLAYQIKTRVMRERYTFADVKLTHREFLQRHQLRRGLVSSLKYARYAPTSVIDRLLWPLIESAQILRKNYGISGYVARKP